MNATPRQVPVAAESGLATALEQARRDAMSLAWQTGYPALVFQELLQEKELAARDYWFRQQHIRRHSARLLEDSLKAGISFAA